MNAPTAARRLGRRWTKASVNVNLIFCPMLAGVGSKLAASGIGIASAAGQTT